VHGQAGDEQERGHDGPPPDGHRGDRQHEGVRRELDDRHGASVQRAGREPPPALPVGLPGAPGLGAERDGCRREDGEEEQEHDVLAIAGHVAHLSVGEPLERGTRLLSPTEPGPTTDVKWTLT
jgi:hypothetical protein